MAKTFTRHSSCGWCTHVYLVLCVLSSIIEGDSCTKLIVCAMESVGWSLITQCHLLLQQLHRLSHSATGGAYVSSSVCFYKPPSTKYSSWMRIYMLTVPKSIRIVHLFCDTPAYIMLNDCFQLWIICHACPLGPFTQYWTVLYAMDSRLHYCGF